MLNEDFIAAVRELKEQPGDGEPQVHGSIELARALHEAGLVDIYRLLIAPVVVGGFGLFLNTSPAHTMNVTDSRVTENGAVAVELVPGELQTGLAVVDDGKGAIER